MAPLCSLDQDHMMLIVLSMDQLQLLGQDN